MKKKFNLIIILILISISLISCKKLGGKKETKLEKKDKAPKSLLSLTEELDKVLTSMVDMKKTIELSPLEFEVLEYDKKEQSKKDEDKSGENKGESKDEKSKIEAENLSSKDKELTKKWNDIDKKIDKIHNDWNEYEAEAVKKIVNPESTKEFKNILNSCTKAVEARNVDAILDTGSQLTLSLASFFDLYKDEIRGELSKIKYAAYQAYIYGGTDTGKAKILLDSTVEPINRLRQKLDPEKDKEKLKNLDKLNLSIEDMKQTLEENNIKLLEIKRDIIIGNIKDLEE